MELLEKDKKTTQLVSLDQSYLITEADIVNLVEHNQKKIVHLKITRQLSCGSANCCSSLFSQLFQSSSILKISLHQKPFFEKSEGIVNQWKLKNNPKIKLAIKESEILKIVISFYMLPLLAFFIGLFLSYRITQSPILIFLPAVFLMAFTFIFIKKGLTRSIISHLKILTP